MDNLWGPMRLIVLAVAFCFSTSVAHSQSATVEQLVSISVNPASPLAKPQRVQLTALLVSYCREVLAALPTNTPAEATWVSNEMKATDSNRNGRLFASREFARYRLQDAFQTCVETATKLLSRIDTERIISGNSRQRILSVSQ